MTANNLLVRPVTFSVLDLRYRIHISPYKGSTALLMSEGDTLSDFFQACPYNPA